MNRNMKRAGFVVGAFGSFILGVVPVLAAEGSLSGEIKLSGSAPELKKIEVTKDQEVCGKDRMPETLLLSKSKGVANAVVIIKDVKGKKLDVPAKNLEFTQKECRFVPHVLTIPVGAAIDILNKDPITHNIHTFPIENAPINKAQPKSLPKITSPKFEVPEIIKVQCDIHRGLMSAWFVVADNPYTAVTDADGRFKIAAIPDGTYKVEIWHELLMKQTKEITIKGGQEAKLDVALEAKK